MEDLEALHNFLQKQFSHYISMIAIGSIAVGDKWINGRSDRDILLIFEKISNEDLQKINLFLSSQKFDDTYMFVLMEKDFFLKNKEHSHDFSGKFRSKTLFGEDIISAKQIPSKEEARHIYMGGLEDVKHRMLRNLVNESFWSEKKIKDVFWQEFKFGLMYLAIKYHCETGIYPKNREELVSRANNKVLSEVLTTLNNIDEEKKEDIVIVASKFLGYIDKIIKA